MRNARLLRAGLVLIAAACVTGFQSQVPQINVSAVKDYVGKVATVCGHVIRSGCSRGEGSFVSFATDRTSSPGEGFRLRIQPSDRMKFGRNFEDQYLDRLVCGLGVVQKGKYGFEMVVTEQRAIAILPDRPGLPPFEPDVLRPCDPGVEMPTLKKDAKPSYTADALRRQVAGTVEMQAVVERDGRIRRARVSRSLDDDLDVSALETLRKWEFAPGTLQGQPVPVVVYVNMTFTLRK